MKADHIHIISRQSLAGQKGLHGFSMPVGKIRFELHQIARPLVALRDRFGRLQRRFQAFAKRGIISGKRRSAAADKAVAIGFEQCQIDTIHRGAAHQSDGSFDPCCLAHHFPSSPALRWLSNFLRGPARTQYL